MLYPVRIIRENPSVIRPKPYAVPAKRKRMDNKQEDPIVVAQRLRRAEQEKQREHRYKNLLHEVRKELPCYNGSCRITELDVILETTKYIKMLAKLVEHPAAETHKSETVKTVQRENRTSYIQIEEKHENLPSSSSVSDQENIDDPYQDVQEWFQTKILAQPEQKVITIDDDVVICDPEPPKSQHAPISTKVADIQEAEGCIEAHMETLRKRSRDHHEPRYEPVKTELDIFFDNFYFHLAQELSLKQEVERYFGTMGYYNWVKQFVHDYTTERYSLSAPPSSCGGPIRRGQYTRA